MSGMGSDPSVLKLSAKVDEVALGLKWMLALLIVLFSIPNFVMSLGIERFAQIFADALPGKQLPLLTVGLIRGGIFWQAVALVWPILGAVNIYRGKRMRTWIIASAVILFLIGLQFVMTFIGCFSPLLDGVVGTPTSSE